MGEVLIPNAVKRDKDYIYYIDSNGSVCRSKMNRKGRPKKAVLGHKRV